MFVCLIYTYIKYTVICSNPYIAYTHVYIQHIHTMNNICSIYNICSYRYVCIYMHVHTHIYTFSSFIQYLSVSITWLIPQSHLWAYIQRKWKQYRKEICTPMVITALFTVVIIHKSFVKCLFIGYFVCLLFGFILVCVDLGSSWNHYVILSSRVSPWLYLGNHSCSWFLVKLHLFL